MQVSYPNAEDRRRSTAHGLGGAIMIHGNCASVGCLAMTDERIQELWVMADSMRRAGRTVHVHIFPARDLAGLIARTPDVELRSFWQGLAARSLSGNGVRNEEAHAPDRQAGPHVRSEGQHGRGSGGRSSGPSDKWGGGPETAEA
jgi:hypothetical protein